MDYSEYQDQELVRHEGLCKRCGSCCGIKDGDPCEHLKLDRDDKYFCDTYETRFGTHKTVSGKEIKCVPIRNLLHKTWYGRSTCAYVKEMRS